MTDNPETIRSYAAIFAAQRRDPRSGSLYPPTEACFAASVALHALANRMEALQPPEKRKTVMLSHDDLITSLYVKSLQMEKNDERGTELLIQSAQAIQNLVGRAGADPASSV